MYIALNMLIVSDLQSICRAHIYIKCGIQHFSFFQKIYVMSELLENVILFHFHVRILTSFGAGDLGTEVDFLYAMMWVTKVTF